MTQTVVVLPGGDGGSSNLYSYLIDRTGVSLLSQTALPTGNYPSSAVCFDATSRGSVTDCVVLSDAGVLVRVPVLRDGTFGAPINLYPTYAPVLGSAMVGEKFYTHPAVYFLADNRVAYAFGSGDVKNLGAKPSVPNRFYKVVDGYPRGAPADAASVCQDVNGSGTAGIINLASSAESIVSPPIVGRGIVAFSTYSAVNDCTYGDSYVYAMDSESCVDATTFVRQRPEPTRIGSGVPMSPVLIRASDSIVGHTTTTVATVVAANGHGAGTKNRSRDLLNVLYYRYYALNR